MVFVSLIPVCGLSASERSCLLRSISLCSCTRHQLFVCCCPGKKWEVTKPAGPVRPQDAGQLKVAEAVRPSNQKLSPREEIEEQTRRAREKRCLSASGPAGPVTPPQGRSSLTSGDTTPRGVHEDGTNKEASSPGSKSLEPEGDEEAGKEEGKGAQDLSEKLASAAEALKAGTGTNSPHVEETEAKSVDHQPEETTREGGPEDQRRAGGREGEKGGADTGDNGALSRGSSQDEQGHRFSSGSNPRCGTACVLQGSIVKIELLTTVLRGSGPFVMCQTAVAVPKPYTFLEDSGDSRGVKMTVHSIQTSCAPSRKDVPCLASEMPKFLSAVSFVM